MSLTGSIIPSIEQDWKYLCRPIDAEDVRITDHNSIRAVSDKSHAESVSWVYSNLDSERNADWYKQKIKLVCRNFPFSLEDRITPSSNSYLDAKFASLRQKVDVDKTIWEWLESEQGTPLVNAVVDGGFWTGEKAGVEGCGFKVYNTTGVNNLAVRIKNVHVGDICDDAFFIQIAGQRCELLDNWTSGLDLPPAGIGGRGIYMRSVSDAYIRGGGYQGALEGLYTDLISDLCVDNVYFGGSGHSVSGYQVVSKYNKRLKIMNSKIMDGDYGGIQLIQSGALQNNQCLIVGNEIISDNLLADDTYIAVALEDSTNRVIVALNNIGYKGAYTAGNRYAYGVREVDATCNWNEVGPNTYNNIATADVSLQGANSTDHQ